MILMLLVVVASLSHTSGIKLSTRVFFCVINSPRRFKQSNPDNCMSIVRGSLDLFGSDFWFDCGFGSDHGFWMILVRLCII